MNKTYSEKLRDPRWQKKRLEVLERAGWKCQRCGTNESELHVHHKMYVKDREPWEYEDENFVVVCDKCHEIEHERMHTARAILARYDLHIDLALVYQERPENMDFLVTVLRVMCRELYNEKL